MEVEIIYWSESKRWHKKGNLYYYHREDGPAIMFDSGKDIWCYYNEMYETPKEMPLNLFLAYCKWEYKKNGN